MNGQRIFKAGTVDVILESHLKNIGKSYGLGGKINKQGCREWGGAAGARFWVDRAKGHDAVFMIQNWGSKPQTWDIFKKHARAALKER